MPIVQSKQFGMSQPNVRHKVESYTYSYKQDALCICSNAATLLAYSILSTAAQQLSQKL